ncbi:hypothetical protein BR93DRAFT_548744 [Coniochaeta sp. PMI_546]|nr:hypothetical protein BR93DRAFT_548744 [Coniochaeta sp. PMI_546]
MGFSEPSPIFSFSRSSDNGRSLFFKLLALVSVLLWYCGGGGDSIVDELLRVSVQL